MQDLRGKNAVVTGATGILGRHFCRGLAEAGCNVGVLDLDPDQVKNFSAELETEFKIKSVGLVCDVSNEEAIQKTVREIDTTFGGIHILHNNAAAKTPDVKDYFLDSFDFKMTDWKKVMSVNVDGMFMMAREVARSMIKNKIRGSIVQVGSIYGVMGPDNRIYDGSFYLGTQINTPAIYAASKGAVVNLTRYLATTWATHGIRVNTLVPGGVQSGQNKVFMDKYSARVPLGRMAEPREMVGPFLFLASDLSSYITGHTLMVDGGLSAW